MSPPGPRRRAALAHHKAIRAKLSPTELPALETAIATPQQSSRDVSTWGHKRPRTCLGRGAQQQLSMDQQELQDAQHQLALDQQQLQGAQHQLAVDQQQLQGAQRQLAVDQQQLQGAQHQLAVDQQQLQDAQHQLAVDQQQLLGAQHQLAVDQQQLQGAQHQLAVDQQQLQDAQHQLAVDQQQLQGAQRQLAVDQQQLQDAQHQLAVDQQQLQGAQRQLAVDQQQLQGAQHQLAVDQQQLQDAQHQLAVDQQQLQGAQRQLAVDQQQLHLNQQQLQDAQHQVALDLEQLQGAQHQLGQALEQLQNSLSSTLCQLQNSLSRTLSRTLCQLQNSLSRTAELSVKQYAPVKQKEGPARIELQQFKLSLREVVDKLNEQMPSYIWHHFVAHHQLAVFRRQQQAVQEKGDHGRVVISCDWSERLTVERPTEIQSDHWHHHNVGIFVACAYFRNDKDEYREETVYILTDGKDQSAAVTQAALHQVLDYLQGERCMVMKQLCMWSDGCAAQFKGTPALQLHRRMAMSDKKEDAECLRLLHARAPHIASAHMTLNVHLLKEYARECLGWKGKRLTQKKPLLRADILEHLRWEQEMEEDQLAEVGVDEADE
ncbi:hypothetical protein QJQ45_028179, partial [Haematococcus lacustris]